MPRACVLCTFINENDARTTCELCDTALPALAPADPPHAVDQPAPAIDESKSEPDAAPNEENAEDGEEVNQREAEAKEAKEQAEKQAEEAKKAAQEASEEEDDESGDEPAPNMPELKLEGKEGAMVELLGTDSRDYLLDNCGQHVPLSTLDNKIVALYFSAHWCPPCRRFTPMLARIYRQLKGQNQPFEIVFCSSDQGEAEFKNYFGTMPWLALPYSDRKLKEELSQRFKVRGIPSLIILNEFGKVFSLDGRTVVMEEGVEGFPWRPDPAIEQAAREKFYTDLNLVFQSLDTKKEGKVCAEQLKKRLNDAKVVDDADERSEQIIKEISEGQDGPTQEAWVAYFEKLVKINDDEIFSLNVLKSQFGLATQSDVGIQAS